MRQFALPRPFYYLSQNPPIDLSDLASERLRWLKTWQRLRQEGYTADRAAELLKLPRSTIYRWKKRLEAEGVRGLEDRSRRPKNCRRPQWSPELAQAVQDLREEYGWDKVKLAHMLKQEGWQTSASTVGRILTRLKARGVLREPLSNGIIPFSQWDQTPPPPCEASLRHPQAQRLHSEACQGTWSRWTHWIVRPLPGKVIKQFTARDMVSRWDVIEAFRSATARNASSFLDTLIERSPYPVKAVQVDGGSEFQADFELACAEKGIRLFVLPPRSPKLNGHVERAQRTHTEEFHDRYMGDLDLTKLNQAMRAMGTCLQSHSTALFA